MPIECPPKPDEKPQILETTGAISVPGSVVKVRWKQEVKIWN